MPVSLTKQTGASVATPASGKVSIYVDSATGEPSYKDDAGTTASLKGDTGAAGATGATGAAGADGEGVPAGGTTGQVLQKASGTDYDTEWATPSGGGGSADNGWWQYKAAALEPDALEAIQKDTFSYAVGSSATKLLMASWQTQLAGAGRFEVRNPQRPVPLRGVTLSGSATGSSALILDPALPTYADAWATYQARLQAIYESQTRVINITAAAQSKPILPGPYGAIITSVTTFNLAWLVLRWGGASGPGLNLWDEISDADTQRVGDALMLPVSAWTAGVIESSTAASGSESGCVTMVLCDPSWSAIADANTYSYREDFWGDATLNTSDWTRVQSTTGNVEIDTNYQWVKLFGNASWGTNGLYRTTTNARSNGRQLIVSFYAAADGVSNGLGGVGWSKGSGQSYSDFAHLLNFASANVLNVYEDGTLRGTVGTGWTGGCIYQVRITQTTSGATYEIQGGPQYPRINSGSWTDITPGTTSSTSTPLTPGATGYSGSPYVSDFRVIG